MGNSPYSTLILIILMVLAFYFLIMRPNKKRQLAQQQTMNQLVPGTRVLLTSGIFGTIAEIGDKQAVLELSPGVHLTVLKPAIARVVREGEEDTDDELEDDESIDNADGTGLSSSSGLTGTGLTGTGSPGDTGGFSSTGSGTTSSHALDRDTHETGTSSRNDDPYSGTSTSPLKD